jgi:hypothetical protein
MPLSIGFEEIAADKIVRTEWVPSPGRARRERRPDRRRRDGRPLDATA